MTAPEKCPRCGAEQVSFLDHGAFVRRTFACGSHTTGDQFFYNRTPFCEAGEKWAAERDALLAANAEIEARVTSLEEDIAELREENCSMSHTIEVDDAEKIAELEARLAASVERDTAIDAICYGIDAALNAMDTCGMGDLIPFAKRSFPGVATLALARAEAEAAKPQTDKEKSDG